MRTKGDAMPAILPVWATIKGTYAAVFRDFSGFIGRIWAWMLLTFLTVGVMGYLTLKLPAIFAQLNLTLLILLPMYAGLAVTCHRFVQLGEDRKGFRALRFGYRELKVCAIGTMLAIGVWGPLVLGAGIITTRTGSRDAVLAVVLYALALSIAFLYMTLRLSLAFPLAANDERRVFDQSWSMLRGNVFRLFVVMLCTYYPIALLIGKLAQLILLAVKNKEYVSMFVVYGLLILVLTLSVCMAASAASVALAKLRGTALARA